MAKDVQIKRISTRIKHNDILFKYFYTFNRIALMVHIMIN